MIDASRHDASYRGLICAQKRLELLVEPAGLSALGAVRGARRCSHTDIVQDQVVQPGRVVLHLLPWICHSDIVPICVTLIVVLRQTRRRALTRSVGSPLELLLDGGRQMLQLGGCLSGAGRR